APLLNLLLQRSRVTRSRHRSRPLSDRLSQGPPDTPQCRVHRLPLPPFLGQLLPTPPGDPIVFATAAALGNSPARIDITQPLQPVQNGIQHPVGPFQATSRQFPHSLEDGVSVAGLFRQDRQDDGGRGRGNEVFIDVHHV